MSDPDIHWRPKWILQRASNVLTSNGNPVAAFTEVFMEREDSPLENNVGSSLSRNSLGASIKRKLQGAKDIPLVRSISLRSPASSGQQARRQIRAFSSDSSATRPQLVYPKSFGISYAPPAQPTEALVLSPKPPQPPFVPRKSSMADVVVPQILQKGVPMTKVSATRQKTFVFQLDPDQGQIVWESKKRKISERYDYPSNVSVTK
jgi:phosphatidylinositol phospholipase C, delta